MKSTIGSARKMIATLDTSTRLNAEVSRLALSLTEDQYSTSGHLLDLTPKYYVYVLMDPTKPGTYKYRVCGKLVVLNYEPFYVGKGHGTRVKTHVSEARNNVNPTSHKENRIRKILRAGHVPIEQVASAELIESVAFAKEIILIRGIGRRSDGSGPLTNISSGGDGLAGIAKTPEHRKNLSRPCREETKQKLREVNLGKTHSESTRQLISEKSKAMVRTESHKLAISEALRGKSKSAEHRTAVSEAKKGRTLTSAEEKHLQKLILSNVGRKHSEESKRKRSEKLKGRPQPRLVCPHCDLEGAESAMKRWHFDNCRSK